MDNYPAHASRAEELLAMVNPNSLTAKSNPEVRIQMAQVEAILALAAAVAGRHGGTTDEAR